jgi:hypothetical protein
MPFSWKKATNFGFIYELSNSKKNAVWEGLYSAANPSIKNNTTKILFLILEKESVILKII